jgi:hypothetical protein
MRIRVALLVLSALVLASCGPETGSSTNTNPNVGPALNPAGPDGMHMLSVAISGPGRVLSLPPAIDCPGACSAAFPEGTSVTLAAAAMDIGMFVNWSGDCTGAMGCFVDMDREAQVMAMFDMGMPMPMGGLTRP